MKFQNRDFRRDERGFTLVELITSLFISAIISLAIYSTYVVSQRAYSYQENVSQAQQSGRMAMTLIARDIRDAGAMGYGFPKSLSFTHSNNSNVFETGYASDVLDIIGITGSRVHRIDPLLIQEGGYPTGGASGTMTLNLEGSAFGFSFSSNGYTLVELSSLCPAPGTNNTGCLFILTRGGAFALVEGSGTITYPGTIRHGEDGNTLVDISIRTPPTSYNTDPVFKVLNSFRGNPSVYFSEGHAFYLGFIDKTQPEGSPAVRYTIEEDSVGGTYNLLRNRQIMVQGVEDLQFAFLSEGDPLVPLCSWNNGAVTSCSVNVENIRQVKVGMVITETERERKAPSRANYSGGVVVPNTRIDLFDHRYGSHPQDRFVRRLYTQDIFWRNFGG